MKFKLLTKLVVAVGLSAVAVTSANSTFDTASRYMNVYEQHAYRTCKNTNSCLLVFGVAADHINVTNVSCNFYYNSQAIFPTGIAFGTVSGSENFNIGQFVAGVQALYQGGGVSQWQFNNQTNHVVPRTYRPGVIVNLAQTVGTMQVDCTIHGVESNPS